MKTSEFSDELVTWSYVKMVSITKLYLTLDIIKSWFKLMDEDGWIGREQILGPEARSKVPSEFQVQYPHYANPPTLFMVINSFLDKLDAVSQMEELLFADSLTRGEVLTLDGRM